MMDCGDVGKGRGEYGLTSTPDHHDRVRVREEEQRGEREKQEGEEHGRHRE